MRPRYRSEPEVSPTTLQDGFQYSRARFSAECLWPQSLTTNALFRPARARGEAITEVNFSAREIIAVYYWFDRGERPLPPPVLAGHSRLAEVTPGVAKVGEALPNNDNCLLCALRNKPARSPLGSLHGLPETWAISICYDHGKLLERQDRRGQAIATLRANIEILVVNDYQPIDTRAWLRMAWRGVGYWVLSDADLSRLGVSFFHILDNRARPCG